MGMLVENMQVFVRVVELGSLSAAGQPPAAVAGGGQPPAAAARGPSRRPAAQPHHPPGPADRAGRGVLRGGAGGAGGAWRTRRASPPTPAARRTATCGSRHPWASPAGSWPRSCRGSRRSHPQLAVRLRLSDHLLDLVREAVDVAIRLAVLPDFSLIARKIADCPRILCAAPAYLAAHGTPARPEDLLDHQCLLLRFPGSLQYRWTLRTPDGPEPFAVGGRLDADDGDMLTEWALLGQGIALKPVFEVAPELRAGRLVPRAARLPARAGHAGRGLPAPQAAAGQGQGVRRFHGRGGRQGRRGNPRVDRQSEPQSSPGLDTRLHCNIVRSRHTTFALYLRGHPMPSYGATNYVVARPCRIGAGRGKEDA